MGDLPRSSAETASARVKPGNEGLFCREQALSNNPLLQTSLLYVTPSLAERLLALHALFAAVERIVSGINEEEVALKKFAWWYEEIERAKQGRPRHPVMRELQRSGAIDRLPWDRVMDWLDYSRQRIDASPLASMDELAATSRRIGEPLLRLELAVTSGSIPDVQHFRETMVRMGLMQLVRESKHGSGSRKFSWIPGDVLARHGRKRTSLEAASDAATTQRISSDILDKELIGNFPNYDILGNISDNKQHIMNIVVLDTLAHKKFKSMKKSSPIEWVGMLETTRFGDAVAAWRAARQINRLK